MPDQVRDRNDFDRKIDREKINKISLFTQVGRKGKVKKNVKFKGLVKNLKSELKRKCKQKRKNMNVKYEKEKKV